MKIVILGTLPKRRKKNQSFGGAEKTMINLASYLANKGYDVTFCSVAGDNLIYPIDSSVKLIMAPVKEENRLLSQLRTFMITRKFIRKIKPDIIVSFWLHPTLYAMKFKKKYKIIFCERNNPATIYNKLSKKLLRYILKKSNGLIFQTQGVLDQFTDLHLNHKSIVIPNPIYIDKQLFKYIEKKDNRIVTVGRLTEQKNQKLLITAFSTVQKKYPDLTLEIFGEGSLEQEISDQISKLDLTEKVFLKGTSKDVLNLIHTSKLFIFTSLYEGMPNALIEAQGLGIPCISADCPPGGPAYLIEEGKTGLLFENNNLDSLIDKINFALENYEKMILMSKNAYENIYLKHDQNKIFNEWEIFIKNTMKG